MNQNHNADRKKVQRKRRQEFRNESRNVGPKSVTVTSPTLNPDAAERMGKLAKEKGDFWK